MTDSDSTLYSQLEVVQKYRHGQFAQIIYIDENTYRNKENSSGTIAHQ